MLLIITFVFHHNKFIIIIIIIILTDLLAPFKLDDQYPPSIKEIHLCNNKKLSKNIFKDQVK